MKSKRLLSILLAAIMLFSTVIMSGCSGTNSEENTANMSSTREITTLSMYILTGDETTKESADMVQMELNRILLPEYKTMLKIHYLTLDEYWEAIDAILEETDPAKDILPDGKIDPESLIAASIKGTEGLSFNGLIDFMYDVNTTELELTKPQIDLFVVNDYDKYCSLVEDGKILNLNSYLDYDSKILTKYIYPTILSAARVGKEVYGIPTNKALEGEYTYLVFNKDLLDKYGYEVKDLTAFSSNKFKEYMSLIKANEPGIWPVSKVCDIAGAEMYDDSFITISSTFNSVGSSSNASFMETRYMDHLATVKDFAEKGYYPQTHLDGYRYAVEVQTSNVLEEVKEWTDQDGTTYVRYLYDIPRITVDDAFTSVMCVSSSSPNPARAMELITLLQTDSELANLLQYGIEGVNYNYNEFEDSITMTGNTYVMDNYVTGNTYIKYPPNNDHDYVENAKKSNLRTAPSAHLGFVPSFSGKDEKSDFECISSLIKSAQQAILDGGDLAQIRSIVNRELVLLGYGYSGTTTLSGVFGKMQSLQAQQSAVIAKNFGLAEEILSYNEPYGIYLSARTLEKAEGEATDDGATEDELIDGEVAEDVATEGDAVDGEAIELYVSQEVVDEAAE
ncbi:MAG: hypothetical protein J6K12_04665 [Clostridia bacterium]|nr:hypothetical protein [Clostridia bacterium]